MGQKKPRKVRNAGLARGLINQGTKEGRKGGSGKVINEPMNKGR